MPSIGRVYADYAGGRIITGSSSVFVNDFPIVVIGSIVEDHGEGRHDNARMQVAYQGLVVDNKPVCLSGMPASCGHPLISNSSVEVG